METLVISTTLPAIGSYLGKSGVLPQFVTHCVEAVAKEMRVSVRRRNSASLWAVQARGDQRTGGAHATRDGTCARS